MFKQGSFYKEWGMHVNAHRLSVLLETNRQMTDDINQIFTFLMGVLDAETADLNIPEIFYTRATNVKRESEENIIVRWMIRWNRSIPRAEDRHMWHIELEEIVDYPSGENKKTIFVAGTTPPIKYLRLIHAMINDLILFLQEKMGQDSCLAKVITHLKQNTEQIEIY